MNKAWKLMSHYRSLIGIKGYLSLSGLCNMQSVWISHSLLCVSVVTKYCWQAHHHGLLPWQPDSHSPSIVAVLRCVNGNQYCVWSWDSICMKACTCYCPVWMGIGIVYEAKVPFVWRLTRAIALCEWESVLCVKLRFHSHESMCMPYVKVNWHCVWS